MSRRLLLGMARFAGLSLVTVALGGSLIAAVPPAADYVHPSGITVLDSLPPVPPPLTAELSAAVGEADRASLKSPDQIGIPWVDRNQAQVVLPAVGIAGQASASSILGLPALATVSRRIDVVQHSRTTLQRIVDGAIGRQTGGRIVYASYPDPEHDRVILEVDQVTDPFLYDLASRFDATAIAVYAQPSHTVTAPASRNYDGSPFWGGAQINAPAGGCTDAFSWYSGPYQMMLTAGHCAPNGGSVSTPVYSMGSVNAESEESWNPGTGTVYLTGQSTYRGDIALIRINSGKSSEGWMYTGGWNSNSGANVKQMWSRSPQSGDSYCTGGYASGEVCSWVVDWVGGDYYYSGTGETARHVTHGTKKGQCIDLGDSGGPVYTYVTGGVAAKGIISGAWIGDSYADWYEPYSCENVFTDIWDAYYALPGILRTS